VIAHSIRSLGVGVGVFFSVTTLSFLLYHLRGAYAIAFNVLGEDASAEEIQRKIIDLGLDRPLITQLFEWFGGLFTGDLGRSYTSNQPVIDIIATRIPVTLSLVVAAMLITVVFSVFFGVIAATRGGAVDRGVQGLAVLLGALPPYWVALVLVIAFAINLRWLPATGFVPLTDSVLGWASTIVLPAVSIAIGATFGLAVWIRSSIIDLQRQDFVRTLRSRGIGRHAIMYRHILRNAAAPTIQLLALMMIALLGGAIIVERIFALPGVGMMALNAGQVGDIPVVLASVAFLVLVVVVINLFVDIVNGFLNPKVRTR
jgi:peptide/nickel transport system permease protein